MKKLREELHREPAWQRCLSSPVTWIIGAAVMLLIVVGMLLPALRKMEAQQPPITVDAPRDPVDSESRHNGL